MQLYAITDRRSLGEDQDTRLDRLLGLCTEWACGGVDYIQIREKDLDPGALLSLAAKVVEVVRSGSAVTRVLLNGSSELALICGADGVHLPRGFATQQIATNRKAWLVSGTTQRPVLSVACHSVAEVERAETEGADMALLAPIFGKQLPSGEVLPGLGLDALKRACEVAGKLPIIALGGVTPENACRCLEAGCAGVAGIRLFNGEGWRDLRR